MKATQFNPSKYGKELLLDLGRIENVPAFTAAGKPHSVDFFEVLFLRKGDGELLLDDQVIELGDRKIIFISPYQRKVWKIRDKSPTGYFFIFARNFLELFFTDPLFVFRLQFFHNHQTPLWLDEAADLFERHQAAFGRILAELESLQNDSEDFIRAELLLILAGLNRRYCTTYGLTPERSPDQDAYRFKKLVEEKIRTLQKVDDFARHLQISRVTLNKRVKAKFGVTASEFIKTRLQTEILKELLFTHKTVAEIAYDLNFSEPHHLIRFFRRFKQQTPSEFRALYQNGYLKE